MDYGLELTIMKRVGETVENTRTGKLPGKRREESDGTMLVKIGCWAVQMEICWAVKMVGARQQSA